MAISLLIAAATVLSACASGTSSANLTAPRSWSTASWTDGTHVDIRWEGGACVDPGGGSDTLNHVDVQTFQDAPLANPDIGVGPAPVETAAGFIQQPLRSERAAKITIWATTHPGKDGFCSGVGSLTCCDTVVEVPAGTQEVVDGSPGSKTVVQRSS